MDVGFHGFTRLVTDALGVQKNGRAV
jgi:hypothetical protein